MRKSLLVFFGVIYSIVSFPQFCADFGDQGTGYGSVSQRTKFIDMVLDNDGKIALVGTYQDDGAVNMMFVRLHPEGQFDKQAGDGGVTIRKHGLPYAVEAVSPYILAGGKDGGIYSQLSTKAHASFTSLGTVSDLVRDGNNFYAVAASSKAGFFLKGFQITGEVLPDFGVNGVVAVNTPDSTHYLKPLKLARTTAGKFLVALVTDNPSNLLDDVSIYRFNSDGTPDNTFGSNGVVVQPVTYPHVVSDVLEDSNGKVVITGYNNKFGEPPYVITHRYAANGTPDGTFGPGIGSKIHSVDAKVKSMVAADNGELFFVGTSTLGNTNKFLLAGYKNDGATYTDFSVSKFLPNDPEVVDGELNKIIRLATGKLLVAGYVTLADGSTRGIVLRLLANGNLDTTFGTNGLFMPSIAFNGYYQEIKKLANGKILAAGRQDVNAIGGTDFEPMIARFLPTGQPDKSFGYQGTTLLKFEEVNASYHDFHSLEVLKNGKILAFGKYENFGAFLVVRFLEDGTPDPTFGAGGILTYDADYAPYKATSHDATLDQAERMVMVGVLQTSSGDFPTIVRLLANGSPDATFGTGGKVIFDFDYTLKLITFSAVAVTGNTIYAGGRRSRVNPDNSVKFGAFIVKVNENGTVDNSFSAGGEFEYYVPGSLYSEVMSINVLPSGKIQAIVEVRNDTSPIYTHHFIQLTAEGVLDPSFGSQGVVIIKINNDLATYDVQKPVTDSEGKSWICGEGKAAPFLATYSSQGTLIQQYTFGAGFKAIHGNPILYDDNRLIIPAFRYREHAAITCVDLSSLGNEVVTSVTSPDFEKMDFVVFPNPSYTNKIQIQTNPGAERSKEIKIYDAMGRLVQQATIPSATKQLTLELTHSTGMHIAEMRYNEKVIRKRFVIANE